MADKKIKKYKFNRPSDRVITTTSAVAGVAALGAGLSLAFNPVAIAVAGGIGVGNYALSTLWSIPAYRKWEINRQVKKGRWQALPADAPASRITAQISNQMGRKKAPDVYTVDAKTVAKFALPFGLRWMIKPQEDQVMSGVFAAVPGANLVITTKQALNSGLTEDQLRFIAAHEMSHLQADHLSPSSTGSMIIKKATRVLFWGSLVGIGASIAGVSLPIFAAPAAVACVVWAGSYLAARVLNNFGVRRSEQRADRNGVYITRDLNSAKQALAHIDPTSKNAPHPVKDYLKDLLVDHPFYNRRIKIMTKAFNKVSRLSPLPAPAQAAAPVAAQPKQEALRA